MKVDSTLYHWIFLLQHMFPSEQAAKDVNVIPRTRIKIDSELHGRSIKGTKLLIEIKAIIIILSLDSFLFYLHFSTHMFGQSTISP